MLTFFCEQVERIELKKNMFQQQKEFDVEMRHMNMELSTIHHEANIHISHNKPQRGFEFFGLLISIIYLLYIKQELSQKKRKEKKRKQQFFFHLYLT